MKVLSLSICKKINVHEIRDAQTAIQEITSAMNQGGFETGMLSLTPWLINCSKVYAEHEKMTNVSEACDQLIKAFGEGISTMSVSQCIGSLLAVNRQAWACVKQQAALIKTACTYHVVGKLTFGKNMNYEDGLEMFINCICQDPRSFKLYGSFIKMFQNTKYHVIYYVGSSLASDGIKAVRKMQNHGSNKLFESQLRELGGPDDFDKLFQDLSLF